MTNLEYLEKVRGKDRGLTDFEIEYRKIKALEIIAEELVLIVRELKVLIKAVRGKI